VVKWRVAEPANDLTFAAMKIPLTYGVIMAVAGALLTFAMFFTGMHDSVERMRSGLGQTIAWVVPLAIGIVCLCLAMRDKRNATPPDKNWGYGSALGTGVLTGLFGALFGAVFAYIYFVYINPNISEVIYQTQVAAMESKGMASEQIERAEPMMRKMMSPAMMTVFQSVMGFVWTVLLSLIIAIFFRRRTAVAAPAGDLPPTLG
jgi:hypothetical protein